MKKYLFAFILFSFFSCKSKKTIFSIDKTLKVFFVSEEVSCKQLDKSLENPSINYLKIKYPDKIIQDKINLKLLNILFPENSENKLQKQFLKNLKDSITNLSEADLYGLEHLSSVESVFFEGKILSFNLGKIHYLTPYFFTEPVNFNLETGELIFSKTIFKPEKLNDLVNLCNSRVQETIDETIQEAKTDTLDKEYNETILEIFAENHGYGFTKYDLEKFQIKEENNQKGILFVFNLHFPQVIRALEPDFNLFFTFQELKPFLSETFLKTHTNLSF